MEPSANLVLSGEILFEFSLSSPEPGFGCAAHDGRHKVTAMTEIAATAEMDRAIAMPPCS
jgi:hypothetical protein